MRSAVSIQCAEFSLSSDCGARDAKHSATCSSSRESVELQDFSLAEILGDRAVGWIDRCGLVETARCDEDAAGIER